ncbi:MAG: alpha/beta hydrolase [Croceibacterium sp.]
MNAAASSAIANATSKPYLIGSSSTLNTPESGVGANGQGLLNSNHGQEGGIRVADDFDRRAIPASAREGNWTATDGHAIRLIEWAAPDVAARGSLLFVVGRGDAYEKYLETLEHWRRGGWQVTALEWRGQGGSGRLGFDAVTGHIDSFDAWLADLDLFWRGWAREHRGKRVLAGHSMGGHLVLRALAGAMLEPLPDAVLLSAPMLDIHPEWVPLRLRQALAGALCRIGDPRRPAWKWSEKPGEVPAARQALLTHDAERYADELWWRGERPELVMGPGSWGWVKAALASTAELERPGALEAVAMPVLIVATAADALVGVAATRRAARRLPHAHLVLFGAESRHEILRESDPVRGRALNAIDAFLDRL